MWALPPNPPHVLMPSEPELRDIKEPTGRWRSMDCPLCRGAGQFIGWAPGSTTEYGPWMCDCEEQLLLRRWFRVRGINPLLGGLRWCDMGGLRKSVQDWANAYISNSQGNADVGIGAYLFGATGSGKSAVAHLVAKNFLRIGIDAYVIDGANVLADIQNWSDRERMDRWISRVWSVPVLVFDELGKEVGNPETARMQVERIIQQRLSDRRATIITSNLSPDEMRTKFGGYVLDAVSHHGEMIDCSIEESWRSAEHQRDRFESAHSIKRPMTFT